MINVNLKYIRTQCLNSESNTGNQAAATNRHYYRLNIGHLLENLKSDCTLSGNHQRVIERMHERIAVLVAQLQRLVISVIIDTGHEAHLGSKSLCSLDFRDGCTGREADKRFDAVVSGSERQLKGMGVALVTPFKSDKTIDFEALSNIIEYVISGKADFIVVLGTTGETPVLFPEEKEAGSGPAPAGPRGAWWRR